MRKSFVAILLLTAVAILLLVLKRPEATDTNETSDATADSVSETAKVANNVPESERGRWNRPERQEASPSEAPVSNAVVYGPEEFQRGELQNVVIDGGITLGDNPAFVPRFNPKYRIFGNFISPEENAAVPFDTLSLNLQASNWGENEVTFEIRTRAPDGSWSEWREIGFAEMKEPIHAETPQSVAWQFRVSLFAHDAASSPKVEAVSVEPLAETALDFSANNTQ